MSKRYPDTPCLYPDDPLAEAAQQSGGVLIKVRLSCSQRLNGGCGAPVHLAGTNGGTLPCGSNLTQFGTTRPYYCGRCSGEQQARRKLST